MNLATLKTWMVDTAVAFPLLVGFGVAAEWTLLQAVPASHWFVVSEIGPAGEQEAGQPLKLYGRLAQYREAPVRTSAVLYCDFGDGMKDVYSSHFWVTDYYPPSGERFSTFAYTGAVPRQQAECFVRIVRGVELRYGIWKRQTIDTEPFELKGPDHG